MLTNITSLNIYLKQQQLKVQAKNRLAGYPSGSSDTRASEKAKEIKNAEIAARLKAIEGRLKAGKKISGADMAFLRKHSPALFEKALYIAKEREEYRRRLNKSKTRDEADRVHMHKMQQFSHESKQKGVDSEFLSMRVAAIMDERADYLANGSYRKVKREADIRLDKTKEKKAAEDALAKKLLNKELANEGQAAGKPAAGEEKTAAVQAAAEADGAANPASGGSAAHEKAVASYTATTRQSESMYAAIAKPGKPKK